MFIYKTTNKINGKIYIGKMKFFKDNYFGSGRILKNAISKYGLENFERIIIEENIDSGMIDEREKYWIDFFNSRDRTIGYNIAAGGEGGDTRSKHPLKDILWKEMSEETRNRISISLKEGYSTGRIKTVPPKEGYKFGEDHFSFGKAVSEETRDKISNSLKSYYLQNPEKDISDEIRMVISEKSKEWHKNLSAEEKEKRSIGHSSFMKENNPMSGKKHSMESREKMSKTLLGQKKTEDHKKKLSDSLKGNIPSNRKKISIEGIEYNSFEEASKKLGIPISTIRNRIKSKNYEGYILI